MGDKGLCLLLNFFLTRYALCPVLWAEFRATLALGGSYSSSQLLPLAPTFSYR